MKPRGGLPMKVKVIVYRYPDGGFSAAVPAIPGCVTEGDTREELLANLREAIEGCLSASPGNPNLEPGGVAEEVDL
jgi:predicted RNase H-like HicB family nuclease